MDRYNSHLLLLYPTFYRSSMFFESLGWVFGRTPILVLLEGLPVKHLRLSYII